MGVGTMLVVLFVSSVAAFLCRRDKAQTLLQWLGIVICAGTRNLRVTFKRNPTQFDTRLHIATFDIFLKYLCPPILLGLFVNQAVTDATKWDRGYMNYPLWVQLVAGVGVLGTMFAALIVFTIWPALWDKLGGEEGDESKNLEQVMREMVRSCFVPRGTAPSMFTVPLLTTNDSSAAILGYDDLKRCFMQSALRMVLVANPATDAQVQPEPIVNLVQNAVAAQPKDEEHAAGIEAHLPARNDEARPQPVELAALPQDGGHWGNGGRA